MMSQSLVQMGEVRLEGRVELREDIPSREDTGDQKRSDSQFRLNNSHQISVAYDSQSLFLTYAACPV